ncbi:MAG: hypothetical protein KF895_02970 [Parvibaculum sp.]|nr:hypothetical protein [Parvibaculum sp.]
MTFTNFPNGISSFGMPVLGSGVLFGKESRVFFVDPANGRDGNSGTSLKRPLQSLARAHELCEAGRNDTVFLIGDGSTAATARLSEKLVWSKNATHLIGVTAPTRVAQRARISHAATAPTTVFTPMVEVTASGCVFSNFSLFEGFNPGSSTACVLWEDKGGRNYYENIHFGGMGGTGSFPTAGHAGSACLLLTGGGEHTFKNCTIGLDTIARSAANASLRLRSETARNVFEDCIFLASCSQTSPLFIDANAANALNREAIFKSCLFSAADNISPGDTAPAVAAVAASDANGTLILMDCMANNISAWAAASARVRVNMGVPSSAEAGIAVDAAD